MKKVLSIIMCIAMFWIVMPQVQATVNEENTISIVQYTAYANDMITNLLDSLDVDLTLDEVFITQPIRVLNDSDGSKVVFFVFHQDACIGELMVDSFEGELYASFLQCELPLISAMYLNLSPFYLVSVENMLLICTETTVEVVAGNGVLSDQMMEYVLNCQENAYNANIQRETMTLIALQPVASPRYSGLPSTSATLDVPYVANVNINGGLCWAAATASIIRYFNRNSVADAMSVYNMVVFNAQLLPGSSASVVSALNDYAVMGYTFTTTTIPFQKVTNEINAGYPVYITMGGTIEGEWSCHAVVVCGYLCESDGSDYIQIVDSNEPSGKIWVTINRSTNAIRYVIPYGSGTYTTWYETVYSTNVA